MKTNQVLVRKMGDFDVCQRTSDGMFNATSLLKQWNTKMGMKKELGDYFENGSSKDFINTIIERENLHTGNYPYVKSRASRGDNAGTWMHPLLYIDFAMWINPSFKYDVLKFVYDELVKYRNDAGDAYRVLSAAIARIVEKSLMASAMKDIAKALNYVIFNMHETQIRNKADEPKMMELLELEKDLAKFINLGFISSYDELKAHLRERWREKWQPKVLSA
jgi:hypothetical protein